MNRSRRGYPAKLIQGRRLGSSFQLALEIRQGVVDTDDLVLDGEEKRCKVKEEVVPRVFVLMARLVL